jgi:hypothetical protein
MSVDLYQAENLVAEDITYKDLFYMFPAGQCREIPRRPAFGLPGHLQT